MKIPVVNEQDEIIGYKDRLDRSPEDIIRITSIWITDENGDILMQQRKFNKKNNPGKWSAAVAGTVEESETYESNAYKEMEEEIGVSDVPLTISKKLYGETAGGKRFLQIYTAKFSKDKKLTAQENEVEQLKWFTKEELLRELKENPNDFVGSMHSKEVKELFLS
ncbi:MAG: NUDIX domain-containing protein [Candidatus Pacebacteria bacterium]|nr:NUDIX domain-containing protein [Candidatus Paceibacterota bacterium]MBP9715945.1 NUDIX domain-containing protein [Candidatus Paceibacterota bacterium]